MTAIALFVALAAGLPIARLSDRTAPLLRLLGEAFLLGIGLCATVLFALSAVGVRWNAAVAIGVAAVVAMPLAAIAGRRVGWRIPAERVHLIDLLTLATVTGYGLWATVAPPPEIDFIADWGLKAQAFALHGGIDWTFLTNRWYVWDHPDYPPLVPLTFDWMSLFTGRWAPATLGLLYPAIALALIAILRSTFADELGSPFHASLATLAIAPLAISPWIGIAEGPFIAFATAAVLLARRALQTADRNLMTAAAILTGCAAMTKNEGLAMIVSMAIAVAIAAGKSRREYLATLWPALAIAAPWQIARAVLQLPTDIATGSILARAAARLRDPGEIVRALATYPTGAPLLWIGIALALLLSLRAIRDESFALLWIAAQFAFYIAAYFVTEKDVAWHVRWSWERLVSHLTPALAFVAIVLAARLARRGTMTADA